MPKSLLFLALILAAVNAFAQFDFSRIVREGEPLPGGPDNLVMTNTRSDNPAIGDGNKLAFSASTSGETGLFTLIDGTINAIVFASEPLPGGNGDLSTGINNPVISGGFVSFESPGAGIFLAASDGSSPLITIADIDTLVVDENGDPLGGGETFERFFDHGRSAELTVFKAERPGGNDGLYVDDGGSLFLVLEEGGPSPLGAPALIISITAPHARQGSFTARVADDSGNSGIVGDFGAGLEVLVDQNIASPSGLGNFIGFDESSIDGDFVVFQGRAATGWGTYLLDRSTGTLTTIADSTVPAPGYPTDFTFAGNPSISGNSIFFEGGDLTTGLFLWTEGVVRAILLPGDLFDGKIVSGDGQRVSYALEDGRFAFRARFDDGDSGYYVGALDPLIFSDRFEEEGARSQ